MAPRMTADDRREQLLGVALRHFGRHGLHGTKTEAIAKDAGISHAYVFRFFPTKRELFLACVDRAYAAVLDTFEQAAADPGDVPPLEAMGKAYIDLLTDRDLLLAQLASYAACGDEEIQAHVREGYGRLVSRVQELSGAEPEALWTFFAHGMLLNVVAALRLDLSEEDWAAPWADPHTLMEGLR